MFASQKLSLNKAVLHKETPIATSDTHCHCPQLEQRQTENPLFYHMLNRTLFPMPQDKDPTVLKTMHYPRKPTEPPSRDPPPYPPWMPVPGGTLGGEPQRLRVASRKDSPWVGVDAFGKGGSRVETAPKIDLTLPLAPIASRPDLRDAVIHVTRDISIRESVSGERARPVNTVL